MNASDARPLWGDHGRLRSLWDMLKLDQREFAFWVAHIQHIADFYGGQSTGAFLTDETKRRQIRELRTANEQFISAGLEGPCDQIERIIEACRPSSSLEAREFGQMMAALTERIEDECGRRTFLVLTRREAEYFSQREPMFGYQVCHKFPKEAAFEIAEAAKCLALSRSTAAVFHLMRVMEIGIRAVSSCLGIPDPVKPSERNWSKMLKNIMEDGIQRRWPTSAQRMAGDGAFFESLYVSLDAVRNPWRNSTMHIEHKYTNDDAEHIFVAVKGFMKKLATRCDENGLPLA